VIRIAILTAALVAGFLAFWVLDVLDSEQVRDWIEPLGAGAAPAFIVVSALLGAALVPGPILAGTSGLLFGAAVGTPVTIAAATLSAVLSLRVGRHAGGDHVERLVVDRERAATLLALTRRHGTLAVALQRLAPLVPDAPVSYAFGAMGLRTWQIAAGTVLGSAPRAFAYTSIGASLDDPGSPLALAGWAAVIVTGIAGALLGRRVLRSSPRPAAAAGTAPRPARSERP
jgi:uncharacterized membrane protein YdjX (TVP38/TMEM64 family)